MGIAALPLVFLGTKFWLWHTYGVFDFYTFHLAGVLANQGRIEALYHPDIFMGFFAPTYGSAGLLPWFYPPILIPYCQFLALFPVNIAYLVNGVLSITAYYAAVSWAFPRHARDIIILSVLPMIVLLGFGHPSILLLSLIIAGSHLARQSLGKGLLALTISAAKPHLGGIVLLFLFLRSPRQALLPSVIIFIGFIGGGALLYGGGIWLAFLHGIGAAATYVGSGTINQQWIASVYGTFLAYGASNAAAIFAHVGALLGVTGLALYAFRGSSSRRFWAASGMAMVFASPYLMYYDLVFFLFPMALVIDSIDIHAARLWVYGLFIGELAMLAILGFETAAGLGAAVFLGFAAMLLFGKIRFGRVRGA